MAWHWVFGNWHTLLPPPWASVVLGLASALAGGIIGAERESKSKPAGLRTMAMVSIGAAVFTMVSIELGLPSGDRARIAAQVVTGIGFLGAGAILRGPQGVLGLTTAATIWVTAAVGMVIGAGFAGAGLLLGLGAVLILVLSDRVERRFLGPCSFGGVAVSFDGAGGKAIVKIEDILDEYQIPQSERRLEPMAEGTTRLHLHYCRAHRHHKEFLTRLASLPEVRAIERHDAGSH
jgi:putative Mg2+ transporter-C (MgtC) family protein